MIRTIVLAAAMGSILTGCISATDGVSDVPAPRGPYEAMSCDALGKEQARVSARLAEAEEAGRELGLAWLSDQTDQTVAELRTRVATLRGQFQALREVALARPCNAP